MIKAIDAADQNIWRKKNNKIQTYKLQQIV